MTAGQHRLHRPGPLYALMVTVLRYLALLLVFCPMAAMAVFWVYVLLHGGLVENSEVLRQGMMTLALLTGASLVCVVIEFLVVLPVITTDKAREVHGAD
ncbi:MAG: hypothetical protein U1E50_10690 [Caulobacteraceae bacterium]